MKILILSFSYPPYNCMGALRVDKTAACLLRMGHDVHVVTAANQPLEPNLPVSMPSERVHYTPWFNVNGPAELALGGRRLVARKGYEPRGPLRRFMSKLPGVYRALINFPDGQVGWLPFAMWTAGSLCNEWKPDVILASGLPVTALVAAHWLCWLYRIPWVAELRDLWADNHYLDYSFMTWRAGLDQWLERRVLTTASGLITVSDPLAERLRAKYPGKPVAVIQNGLDPEDYPIPQPRPPGPLRIAYTGTICRGRDPGPLFAAVNSLGEQRDRVRLFFYGRYMESVRELARQHELEDQVEIHEPVPYRDAIAIQATSDALLLMLWDHPEEQGVFTGKIFQYLGARRPILMLGPRDNVAADLLLERQAGVVVKSPEAIANQLRSWLSEIDSNGEVAALPPSVTRGLGRQESVQAMVDFLACLLAARPATLPEPSRR